MNNSCLNVAASVSLQKVIQINQMRPEVTLARARCFHNADVHGLIRPPARFETKGRRAWRKKNS